VQGLRFLHSTRPTPAVCQMLWLMLILLIYLSLDLTTFECSKMSNMITLPTLPEPEIDLSMTMKTIERLQS